MVFSVGGHILVAEPEDKCKKCKCKKFYDMVMSHFEPDQYGDYMDKDDIPGYLMDSISSWRKKHEELTYDI